MRDQSPLSVKTGRPPRNWLLGTLAILIGLFLALIAAELTLRAFDLAPAGGLATVTQEEFEQVPGLFAPGQSLIERIVPQLPYHVRIDSLGFRAVDEMPRIRPPGEIRILMLGDSFTFGYLVGDEETLPAQVERLLQSRCQARVRLINAGVGGTTIETATEMAERALPLSIDAVVLTFTENDVSDLTGRMWDELARNRALKSRFPMSVIYPVARHLALWNLMLEARSWLRNRRAPPATTRRASAGETGNEDRHPSSSRGASDSALGLLRDEYQRRLLTLRDRLADRNIPLLFAIYPSHLTIYGSERAEEQVRWVEGVAREAGLSTVNLLGSLRADGRSQLQLFLLPYDGHPSAAGYSVAAPAVAGELLRLPAISAHCRAETLIPGP